MSATDKKDSKDGTKKPLTLGGGGTLGLKKPIDLNKRSGAGTVTVEVKRKRTVLQRPANAGGLKPTFTPAITASAEKIDEGVPEELAHLTPAERAARLNALQNISESREAETDTAATEQDEELRGIQKVEQATYEPDDIAEPLDESIANQTALDPAEATPAVESPLDEVAQVPEGTDAIVETATATVAVEPLRRIQRAVRKEIDPTPKRKPAPKVKVDDTAKEIANAAKQMATPAPTERKPTVAAPSTPLRRIVRRDKPDLSAQVEQARKAREQEARQEREQKEQAKAKPSFGPNAKPANTIDHSRPGNPNARRVEPRRQRRLNMSNVLSGRDDRTHSLASARRRQQKNNRKGDTVLKEKVYREVILPEMITVQELANRMTERTADVVKELMKMGIMATATQSIDADTAELIVEELGHSVRRVAETDVEDVLISEEDAEESLKPRPPVVTIMGHVDHGKTSLLDALRKARVAAGEAGGITQHIGAYQIETDGGEKISFVDTPGHAAFTEMRARGANVTDIVILVIAADDSIMPQTIEALNHAKAADVPIIVAINKIDTQGANVDKVRADLLSHDLQVEEMGGEVMSVPVSAKTGEGLDKLEEAILLQAEVLELKANPDRNAEAIVVESQLDQGRGSVATVLVQRGTLNVGDIFVVGTEWGRVRALVDENDDRQDQAVPAMPIAVLGLNGTPSAGDTLVVVDSEAKAREISEFRQRQIREKEAAALRAQSVDSLFAAAADGKKYLALVVKTDVHGSLEAINAAMAKAGNDEVGVKVIHSGVGAITESDVVLAKASNALVVGFNVRANPQARQAAKRDEVDVRYHSVIYNLMDDVDAVLTGMLDPTFQEDFLGYAKVLEVFNISKVGNIAGCIVTDGIIKRGCRVRLLRDDVVIHEGKLKTLKRFKEEVKEVRNGTECGVAFENYSDVQEGDQVECFDVKEIESTLD